MIINLHKLCIIYAYLTKVLITTETKHIKIKTKLYIISVTFTYTTNIIFLHNWS